MKAGKHCVVMGLVPSNLDVGEGCVIIGPTDSQGNTIINNPIAVGYGAKAGRVSIAIGAFAGAGLPDLSFPVQLQVEIQELINQALERNNQNLVALIAKLVEELRQPKPARNSVLLVWDGIKAIATLDGAYGAVSRLTTELMKYIEKFGD
jgi:hypothetical protein